MPSSFEIQLTESGINSSAPSTPALQAKGVCDSFINVLGTPGIENYIYHRMKDHPTEVAGGLALGLVDENGNGKPSWYEWALANTGPISERKCGFQSLPYTTLTRSGNVSRGHWASTRIPPAGFTAEGTYRLHRDPQPDTVVLYECQVGSKETGHNLVSGDANCEGLFPLGPLGYASTTPRGLPIYRCRTGSADHFISADPRCEGQIGEGVLGYGW